MSFELFISGRYLRSRQRQAFISLITLLSIAGVTVGVMALIIVIAVMSGAESDFRTRILGLEPHVIVMRHGSPFSDYRRVITLARNIDGVKSASPFIYSQVMLRSANMVAGSVLRGIDPELLERQANSALPTAFEEVVAKLAARDRSADARAAPPAIVLGKELAAALGVVEGESVYVLSPKGMISPIGQVPVLRRFRVVGIFQSGFYEYDQSLAYVHLRDAQQLLRMGDSVTGVGIRVKDIYQANRIAATISAKLGFPYYVRDWMQMNRNLFSALSLEKKAMFIILTLIVLVAAFNIASTLIMMVMQKTRDIAILKAMGASDRSIRKIFMFKGMVIGSVGTAIGLGLGFLGCFLLKHYKFIELPGDVYYFTTLPVRLEALDVVLIASAAMLICFLATLYPARQASKLNPVEAIRYG